MQGKQSPSEQWAKICNMRATLLQLQFLYQSISEQTEKQARNFELHQKDRLLQMAKIKKQSCELTERNFKVLLIAKLQSLLAIYEPVDSQIWENLNSFVKYVKMIEEEMQRDVCKLYIGDKVMVDINKCQQELQNITNKIMVFLEESRPNIEQYNQNIQNLQQLKGYWGKYVESVELFMNGGVKQKYLKHLRQRLSEKEKKLDKDIKFLKEFILS